MVALVIRDGGNVARTITALLIRDGGNVQRTITELWIRDRDNVPRLVFNPSGSATLTAEAAPTFISAISSGTGTATTDATTVTPSGGTAPYTYAWTEVSHSSVSAAPTIDSPTAATTTFTQTSLGYGESEIATFRCTVTDSLSATTTVDVNATFVDVGSFFP